MEFVSQLGSSTLDALSYLGSLASLGARAAYYTLVAPFQGKPLRLQSGAEVAALNLWPLALDEVRAVKLVRPGFDDGDHRHAGHAAEPAVAGDLLPAPEPAS